MAEKKEKSKRNTVEHTPKDAQTIKEILKDMDITEYEPRVINSLLEFTYKYVACTLKDAKTYSNHAKKKSIDSEDVKLAMQMQTERTFISPPSRDQVTNLARSKNTDHMPLIKPHCGIRLPQDRYSLSTSNVQLKLPQLTKNNAEGKLETTSKLRVGIMKRTKTLPNISLTHTVSIPKPLFKSTNEPSKTVPKPKTQVTKKTASAESTTDEPQVKRRTKENAVVDLTI